MVQLREPDGRQIHQANTDFEGFYVFNDVYPGSWEIMLRHAVSKGKSQGQVLVGQVTVYPGQTTPFDVALTGGRTLSGGISFGQDMPGSNHTAIEVEVRTLDGTIKGRATALTNWDEPEQEESSFRFEGLSPEVYVVRYVLSPPIPAGQPNEGKVYFVEQEVDLTVNDGMLGHREIGFYEHVQLDFPYVAAK